MILAEKDRTLPPQMASKMDSVVTNLTKILVPNANHWILQDYPDEINAILLKWLKTFQKGRSSL